MKKYLQTKYLPRKKIGGISMKRNNNRKSLFISILLFLVVSFASSCYDESEEKKQEIRYGIRITNEIPLCKEIILKPNEATCAVKDNVTLEGKAPVHWKTNTKITVKKIDVKVTLPTAKWENAAGHYQHLSELEAKEYIIGEKGFKEAKEIVKELNKAIREGKVKISVNAGECGDKRCVKVDLSFPEPYVEKLYRYYYISDYPLIMITYKLGGVKYEDIFLLRE